MRLILRRYPDKPGRIIHLRGVATLASEEPGNKYWAVIAPHWLTLNETWDSGPSAFLAALGSVEPKVRLLYSAHWCYSEVTNGGFHQFFFNTTGILAPEAKLGFDAAGAPELGAIVEQGMRLFGPIYPREREIRLRVLKDLKDAMRNDRNPFALLDDAFYAWSEHDDFRWERAADDFADA